MRRYGPETAQARDLLRRYAELKTADLFPDNPAYVRLNDQSTYELLQQLEDALLALKPANPRDQWWLGQAMALAGKIGDARWVVGPAGRTGNAQGVRGSASLLARLTIRQLWSFRASKLCIISYSHALRSSCRRCD